MRHKKEFECRGKERIKARGGEGVHVESNHWHYRAVKFSYACLCECYIHTRLKPSMLGAVNGVIAYVTHKSHIFWRDLHKSLQNGHAGPRLCLWTSLKKPEAEERNTLATMAVFSRRTWAAAKFPPNRQPKATVTNMDSRYDSAVPSRHAPRRQLHQLPSLPTSRYKMSNRYWQYACHLPRAAPVRTPRCMHGCLMLAGLALNAARTTVILFS